MTLNIRLPGVFVDAATPLPFENGSQIFPYDTVNEVVSDVMSNGFRLTVRIAGGDYFVEDLVIDEPVTLAGWRNGPAVIIGR